MQLLTGYLPYLYSENAEVLVICIFFFIIIRLASINCLNTTLFQEKQVDFM